MRPERPSELLREAKTPAFLVTHLPNIRYLTGVELSSGVLLVTRDAWTLLTDGRYLEAAKENVIRGVRVRLGSDLPELLQRVRRCGFESENVTVAKFARRKRDLMNTK